MLLLFNAKLSDLGGQADSTIEVATGTEDLH